MTANEVRPYNRAGKKEEVEQMFDNIAHRYDFLNHFFSLGIDKIWRRKALSIVRAHQAKSLLDVATGTGDFAITAAHLNMGIERIVGVDISEGMLTVGREKIRRMKLDGLIELRRGDSENLPFGDQTFEAVTVAFGVRNFEHLEKGLSEIRRVLKPGAPAVILEFSRPERFPVKQLFGFYFSRVMPLAGRLMSRDPRAYTYLPESVQHFPSGSDFLKVMEKVGFTGLSQRAVSGGIASIYSGVR